MFNLGKFKFDCPIILAPMAGVGDRVYRNICLENGADYTVSEMVTSDPRLRTSVKTRRRLQEVGSGGIRIVQIAGADPTILATAARYFVDHGADVIDINMGCPVKKVCNQMAGSALMRDERLVASLLAAVVTAVTVPVTLKMRTGWDLSNRNAPTIAHIAQDLGVQLLTVHGRTRDCRFKGHAEFDTVAQIKSDLTIPVIANGDICDVNQVNKVLNYTKCDGLMIGRAALGNPWIFGRMKAALRGQVIPKAPNCEQVVSMMKHHVAALHEFYGDRVGSRVARKHIGWYSEHLGDGKAFRKVFNQIESAPSQLLMFDNYYSNAQGMLAA
ncbi:MAG TPA: tRNA dihydrouridine synthase DusB [Gammaproteobacteria bacterium]|nr:tRNA dihydrouridine synthase DusB [Gammaproteobacteria bacterium]